MLKKNKQHPGFFLEIKKIERSEFERTRVLNFLSYIEKKNGTVILLDKKSRTSRD